MKANRGLFLYCFLRCSNREYPVSASCTAWRSSEGNAPLRMGVKLLQSPLYPSVPPSKYWFLYCMLSEVLTLLVFQIEPWVVGGLMKLWVEMYHHVRHGQLIAILQLGIGLWCPKDWDLYLQLFYKWKWMKPLIFLRNISQAFSCVRSIRLCVG